MDYLDTAEPDDADEDDLRFQAPLADREIHRKRRAVLALPDHLPADADNALFAGPDMVIDIAVMFLAIRGRHQHFHVLAQHFAWCIAEQLLAGERVADVVDQFV